MIKLTESAIEALAIKLFQQLGYIHIYAPDISPDGDHPERARYDEVLLTGRLEKALQRIRNIAQDIVSHFEAREEVFAGKGMIVCMSRRIAADLYSEIIKLRPQWHSDDLNKGVIKVVMMAASSDGPVMAKHHTTKQHRQRPNR